MSLLHEDIRDSLVQAGQQACGYMNCKLFVQTVTGIPKLEDLPVRSFVSEVDLVSGDVLKWGMGTHWAIYIGDGDIMEVEEWGAESRIVPLAEVLEEMDPPDMVFSTATPQREVLLREYIKELLLTEVAKGPQDLPKDTVISVTDTFDGYYISYTSPGLDGPSGAVTIAGLSPEEASGTGVHKEIGPIGNCGGALIVVDSGAEKGWGPMLYDVAMEYATLKANGLTPDRGVVSPDAKNVWDYYLSNRPDVTAHQLDDLQNTLTPQDDDNCGQWSADGYTDDWINSPLSKRYTKPPTTMDKLKAVGKLVEE